MRQVVHRVVTGKEVVVWFPPEPPGKPEGHTEVVKSRSPSQISTSARYDYHTHSQIASNPYRPAGFKVPQASLISATALQQTASKPSAWAARPFAIH